VDLKLDDQGDLAIENGDLVLLTGADAIRQHLKIRLRTFKGEWFLDQRLGVPYFDKILVKNPSLPQVTSLYRKVITDTPGVTALLDLAVSLDNAARRLTVTFAAETTDGPVELTEEVPLS